jgi:hypothetical protein
MGREATVFQVERAGRFMVLFLAALMIPGASPASESAEAPGVPSNEPWRRALARFHRDGGVDYLGLRGAREDLDNYLRSLSAADLEKSSRNDQLAFWINAYNAVTVHFVLERYPDLRSVKDVDGFFDELRYKVAGRDLTLDEIETEARNFGDPRVHFAVVCASQSCPELRGDPYEGAVLEDQLEEQTRRFLRDPGKGLRFDRQGGELWLSSIFKWYAGDFTGGSTVLAYFSRGKIVAWLLPHLPLELADEIEGSGPSVRYLDYDWSLNDRSASTSEAG